MSSDLIFIFAAVAGVVMLGALVGVWWMNREPRVERDASGVVPLFAGTLSPSDEAMADGFLSTGAVRRPEAFEMRPTSPMPASSNGATLDLSAWDAPSALSQASRPSASVPVNDMPSSFSPSASSASPAVSPPPATDDAWPPTPYRPPVVRSFTNAASSRDTQASPLANVRDAARADGSLAAPGVAADVTAAANSDANRDANPSGAADIVSETAHGTTAAPLSSSAPIGGYSETATERQLLRFSPPIEGTLQFLPGRLLVVSGQEAGRELRFVRLPGPNGTEITFGRNDGELYRHIQLRDQTVSRMHAALRFADGRWHLRNLSQTNPVMLDGLRVASGTEHVLDDGARIEMGEVLFSFRNR